MKIAIFHFSPLEHFPPAMNMISFLEKNLPAGVTVRVYSTASPDHDKIFSVTNPHISIKRYGTSNLSVASWERLALYARYYLSSFLDCLVWGARRILYYESISALPVYWISRLKKNIKIFIHYHEYMSPQDYKQIKLLNIAHRFEKKIYHRASWISHTNEKRMELFLREIGVGQLSAKKIMPNFPPGKWLTETSGKKINDPVKIVYVGTLGLETMFIREFASWVEAQKGNVTWDIYSQQSTVEIDNYLYSIQAKFIRVKGMVNYELLPDLLPAYDIGVILHKGETENYRYNAPNKLFEYLACGLDVWFSNTLEGSLPYVTTGTYPQVMALSFDELSHYDLTALVNREGKYYKASVYFCEQIYPELVHDLCLKAN